ncbi:unnamed protein product, partial [Allacma fusca]
MILKKRPGNRMDVAAVVLILHPVPPIGAAIWGPRT